MSQPPDDPRRMPWEPEPPDATDAADQPTIRWSAPDAPVDPEAPSARPDPDPEPPEAAEAPEAPEPAEPPEPPERSDEAAAAAAASPLLSSSAPPPPASGWQPPDAPVPVVGWHAQPSIAEAAPVEGYVIAGPWARLVAWFIDSLLVTLFPTLLSLVIVDWGPIVEAMVEQAQDPSAPVTAFMPVTVEAFIVTLIGVGLSYLYFVGFWTGPWMATPGMRLLRMRVGDEQRGTVLSLVAATKRWFAMGVWLAVLAYVGPFAALAGFGGQLLQVFLFISVIVHARRQGLHDRFAQSIVIRERASGDSAVVFGCGVLFGLTVLMTILFAIVFFSVIWPAMEPFLDELRMRR